MVGYLNYGFYTITMCVCIGVLSIYQSKREYKEIGCISKLVRFVFKSFTLCLWIFLDYNVFFVNYRQFWDNYTMYQILMKAP